MPTSPPPLLAKPGHGRYKNFHFSHGALAGGWETTSVQNYKNWIYRETGDVYILKDCVHCNILLRRVWTGHKVDIGDKGIEVMTSSSLKCKLMCMKY